MILQLQIWVKGALNKNRLSLKLSLKSLKDIEVKSSKRLEIKAWSSTERWVLERESLKLFLVRWEVMRWDPLSLSRKQREERRLRRGPRENLLNFGGQKGARETRRGQVPFDLLLLANLNMVFQVHPDMAGVAWPILHAPTPGQSLTVTLKGYFCVICHFMPLSDFASSESILTCPRVHAHAHTHVCMYIWTCMYTCTYVCLKRYIIFHAANMYVCVCVSHAASTLLVHREFHALRENTKS